MPAPTPLPKFVYKIVPSAPPSPIPDVYPLSELDRKDGFIHLSVAKQIPITAGLFFGDVSSLWIIKIRFAPFEKDTNWDVPGCPHLYGHFGAADVEDVAEFAREEGSDWAGRLAGSAWLE